MNSVHPEYIQANGLWNHFTGFKKWKITCGSCGHGYKDKVMIQEICSSVCPCCYTQNKWSASDFQEHYNYAKHGYHGGSGV